MKGALFISLCFLLSKSLLHVQLTFFSWQLTTNHELANFLFDNPHESNSLGLALLLQEPLMAHDDGSNSNFLTTNKLTLLYSMLTFSFDGLSVA